MSRLTLRLPESLHRQLEVQAKREGTSLNQYIVYALTRQVASGYTVERLSDEAIRQQKAAFDALVERLAEMGHEGVDSRVQQVLAEREEVDPESGLDHKVIERLQARMEAGER
jgi:hypothetical protein